MLDEFYKEFLTDLQALDEFLSSRTGELAWLERSDPDIRRLMEAMAFFSARTRVMATRNFDVATHRLAEAHIRPLLVPQPAMALVQVQPKPGLVEAVRLPQGTQMRFVSTSERVGLFSTMKPVTLLPLAVRRVEILPRPGNGFRIVIGLTSQVPMTTLFEPLSFYIHYLSDYTASLAVQYLLRRYLVQASVKYGEPPDARWEGEPSALTFGVPEPGVGDRHAHPMTDIRSFFHFPEKDLFVNITLPGAERPWRKAWICLDVDERWPTELVLNTDMFRLFVLPVMNLRTDLADPFLCDGTKSSYPLRPSTTHPDDELHSVVGVYQETATGTEPILPAHLSRTSEWFELASVVSNGEVTEHFLRLSIPGAFGAPRPIAVEARWYQPWFDAHAQGHMAVSLHTRHVHGAEIRLMGQVRGHRTSALLRDGGECLQVLSLRSQQILTYPYVMRLMKLLGADERSAFADAALYVSDISAEPEYHGRSVRYVYTVRVSEVPGPKIPMLFAFLWQMWKLLSAWCPTPVDLRVRAAVPELAGILSGGAWLDPQAELGRL